MKPPMKLFVRVLASALGGALIAGSAPAAAKVAALADDGFFVRHLVIVPTTGEEAWAMVLKPAAWWDSQHTWSGDSANLSIDPRAGGCFCEVLPNPASPKAAPRGGVEHMRVIYIERPRALRMIGALGPLQGEAVRGTLTIQLKPSEDGKSTQVLLEYVVGGYARTPFEKLAPAVDGVLGQQVQHLVARLGGDFAAAFALPQSAGEPMAEPASTAPATQMPEAGVLPLGEHPPEAGRNEMIGR